MMRVMDIDIPTREHGLGGATTQARPGAWLDKGPKAKAKGHTAIQSTAHKVEHLDKCHKWI